MFKKVGETAGIIDELKSNTTSSGNKSPVSTTRTPKQNVDGDQLSVDLPPALEVTPNAQ
jgi:hypothetical protein